MKMIKSGIMCQWITQLRHKRDVVECDDEYSARGFDDTATESEAANMIQH